MTNFKRPNLLFIGAQKAGTTAVSNLLSSHPAIFMPRQKEMNFFTNPEWYYHINNYLSHFRTQAAYRYYMEASPSYFWTQREDRSYLPVGKTLPSDLPRSIRSLLGPEVRLLLMLRHPKQRAISAFFHHFRMGRVGTLDRIRDLPRLAGIVDIGFYSDHLQNYLRTFPNESLHLQFFEEFVASPKFVVNSILDWLGLEMPSESPQQDRAERNENFVLDRATDRVSVRGGISQVRALAGDPRFKKMRPIEPPIIEPADIAFLDEVYAEEIEQLMTMFPKLRSLWVSQNALAAQIAANR